VSDDDLPRELDAPPTPEVLGTDELRRSRDGRAASIPRFEITILEGPDRGLAFQSRAERSSIGTHPSCDLVLSDRTVSRFHCEIGIADKRRYLRDLKSRNGTQVNGMFVERIFLHGSLQVQVGKTRLRVDLGERRTQVALSTSGRFGNLIGDSVAMRAAFAQLERAANCDATVILEGETGTGKDAAAESIHRQSARRDRPFVVVDCAAIAPTLVESQVFGYAPGAFTGADHATPGAFEEADGGTLFLDEIGELPLELQPKLLRVLESREVRRLGEAKPRPVDVRILAATHRDLRADVNLGRFRADLYFRLAVMRVRLPPLRERLEDLGMLVQAVLDHLQVSDPAARTRLCGHDAIERLQRYTWPGNIRELRNHLERAIVLEEAPGPSAGSELPPPVVDLTRPLRTSRQAWLRAFEVRYLQGLLDQHGHNVRAAARTAKVDRVYLYRLMRRYGLR
jgi:transcriptional regulator with PAS, ATPase and Fis domain